MPAWLNDVTLYHNRGDTTFTGEDSQYGDFFGLDDLFTENPKVVDGHDRHLQDLDQGLRHRRLPDRHHEARQRRVLAEVRARDPAATRSQHGKTDFFMFGEVFDGSERRRALHVALHDPRQDAGGARLPVPGRGPQLRLARAGATSALRDFFANDDWYTDADSNVYELPTFLGNHDMGRIGNFVTADNPGAGDAELLRPRPARARADVLLPRQPGRLLRRRAGLHRRPAATSSPGRRCSPARSPEYLDDDLLGTDATHGTGQLRHRPPAVPARSARSPR